MSIEPIENLSLIGGHLSLDFVNTMGSHLSDHPSEWLHTYSDAVRWAARAGGLTGTEAAQLSQWSNQQPDAAEAALDRARALRDVCYRLLLATTAGDVPRQSDLETFNRFLAAAPARVGIYQDGAQYAWQFARDMDSLDGVWWRVVWSAADLLTSDQLAQVKVCEGDGCGWLFLDTSRNRSRRWCSMADCGNRAKANRYYQRHKGE